MELILWRHAEAEDGVPDSARKLTDKGLKQAQVMAEWLKPRLPKNTRIIVSPTKRTQQTAAALGDDYETAKEIGTSASAKSILAAAGWPDAKGAVVVVGHQPTL
ncbi:MAG: histidine phosphatase family protein, partial [Nitrosospira sp.]